MHEDDFLSAMKNDVRFARESFGPQPLWHRGASKQRCGEVLLDNAFSLIEGHPHQTLNTRGPKTLIRRLGYPSFCLTGLRRQG
jgi:hypothetical protein